ncbi:hypothetical protein BZA05DRAFT_450399 [Tricharina praecox]|uniref:uncharacterized protein n=1 Tax=Tricharina praecox TaxID=43433 RepID=UPI00221EE144|nr:uncharacterized protein BZA05DRAFT_450399 [Tricharina praecox]KAI5858578.1 hypothetical protein BZA05DRAFT_450399 [Tricharina praecox]
MTTYHREDLDYDYDVSCCIPSTERSLSLAVHRPTISRSISTSHHHSYREREREREYYLPTSTQSPTLDEIVRNNHALVTRLNRKIPPGAVYSQVHPKMKDDGSYPRDFSIALTRDQFEAMDSSTLDRILISYGLLSSFTGRGRDIKRRKLWRLFEYLGADALKPSGGGWMAEGGSGGASYGGGQRVVGW